METINHLITLAELNQKETAVSVLEGYREMMTALDSRAPSRELSLAKTNLEQSAAWAYIVLTK